MTKKEDYYAPLKMGNLGPYWDLYRKKKAKADAKYPWLK
jgi:hypothetical protein